MRCPSENQGNTESLLNYCSGRLDAAGAANVERHIAECAKCREFVRQQRAVWAALDSWDAAPVSLDFDRRLYRRIEAQETAQWWRQVLQPFGKLSFRPAMSLAAAGVAMVAFLLVSEPSKIDAPQARFEPVEVDQVEGTLEDIEMLQQLDALGLSVTEAAPRSL